MVKMPVLGLPRCNADEDGDSMFRRNIGIYVQVKSTHDVSSQKTDIENILQVSYQLLL
jgi:hypothetical protein